MKILRNCWKASEDDECYPMPKIRIDRWDYKPLLPIDLSIEIEGRIKEQVMCHDNLQLEMPVYEPFGQTKE